MLLDNMLFKSRRPRRISALDGYEAAGRWEKLYKAMSDDSYCPTDFIMVFRSAG
jgi:hypothetical protein